MYVRVHRLCVGTMMYARANTTYDWQSEPGVVCLILTAAAQLLAKAVLFCRLIPRSSSQGIRSLEFFSQGGRKVGYRRVSARRRVYIHFRGCCIYAVCDLAFLPRRLVPGKVDCFQQTSSKNQRNIAICQSVGRAAVILSDLRKPCVNEYTRRIHEYQSEGFYPAVAMEHPRVRRQVSRKNKRYASVDSVKGIRPQRISNPFLTGNDCETSRTPE